MSRLIITFMTCFIMDNLLVSFLPIHPIVSYYRAIPNVFLICLAFFTFYDRGIRPFIFAFIFGFLYDVCYADLIGLYTCLFPIITFIMVRFVSQTMPINLLSIMAMVAVLVIGEESIVYFMVETMKTTNMSTFVFVKYILIPTTFFNVLITIVLYPALKRQFTRYQKKVLNEF